MKNYPWGDSNARTRFRKPLLRHKLLNKMTVSELAELSKLSKSYISQVKSGKRPPSQKLLNSLAEYNRPVTPNKDYYRLFMQSRIAKQVSPTTIRFYKVKLGRFFADIDPDKARQHHIEQFLIQFPNSGNRHDNFQVIKTFYIWREQLYGLQNPSRNMPAPKVAKLILPSLTREHVSLLIETADNPRDKAIIALFTESGLRLSELVGIEIDDINWDNRIIRVMGKGRKEAYAPFGQLTEKYLKAWLLNYTPNDNIWGINPRGIQIMLKRLGERAGIKCNSHTFRRTFACLLRKAGVDTMTIKDLGRWESLEMVQRYTRSVTFHDSLKFYKAPLD
ncbi:tyrosine-type recombinase/integrase [Chloroflexota bacterium]